MYKTYKAYKTHKTYKTYKKYKTLRTVPHHILIPDSWVLTKKLCPQRMSAIPTSGIHSEKTRQCGSQPYMYTGCTRAERE